MELSFTPPSEALIQELLENLSTEDRAEILALGLRPEPAIRASIEESAEVVAISNEKGLGCIVGVVDTQGLVPRVYPWLLGTNLMQEHGLVAARMSRKLIRRWQGMYPYMENYVDVRHQRAIDWLTWLGASWEEPQPFGPYQRLFRKFYFGSPQCASV